MDTCLFCLNVEQHMVETKWPLEADY